MTSLLDISQLSDCQCDHALEGIYKALTENPDDDAIWSQMNSPFLRKMVELFTQRGLMRLDGFRNELVQWLNNEKFSGGSRGLIPTGMMQRWTPAEIGLVKMYLANVPADAFTLEDSMLLVEYLVQRYLPIGDLRTEAEWLAVKSTLMGRVQANMPDLTLKQADVVLERMPTTVAGAASEFPMRPTARAVLDYATAHTVENVQRLSDEVRHRMRMLVMKRSEEKSLGIHDPSQLQSDLLEQFGTLNRDWRRIAVTEAVENSNQGYIAMMSPGDHVKRAEHYTGACAFCRKIDGMTFEVVEANAPDKDGWKQVWPGKTNIGRSAAPRARVGGVLVERDPDEMWWPAAGTQHPSCRGFWLPEIRPEAGDDPAFAEWLRLNLSPKHVE